MVKKKGPVWKHWKQLGESNTHPSVQCNYCSKIFDRAVPKRMQAHLDQHCAGAPNNAKSQSRQSSHESAIPSNDPNATARANTSEINRPVKRIKNSGID